MSLPSIAEFLSDLNRDLQPVDAALSQGFDQPQRPVLAIVALPRAGSTLLQQILLSRFAMGYVSNICSRFWQAPVVGALLHKAVVSPDFMSSFQSEYGLTEGAEEPHEWGHFWRRWLALEGDEHYCVDDSRLRSLPAKLAAMEAAHAAPLMFDNVFMMANIALLRSRLPGLVAVHLKRSPYFVCNSILKARLKRYGTVETFYGHRPRDMARIERIGDPVEQVVRQVRSIQNEIEEALAPWPAERLIEIDYEDLVRQPEAEAMRIARRLGDIGCRLIDKPCRLPDFQSRNTVSAQGDDWSERLEACYRHCFETRSVGSEKATVDRESDLGVPSQ